MKKNAFYLILFVFSACLCFLAACGSGEIVDLSSQGSPEWAEINKTLENLVDANSLISKCQDPSQRDDTDCPSITPVYSSSEEDYDPPVYSSSSFGEEISSDDGGGNPPSGGDSSPSNEPSSNSGAATPSSSSVAATTPSSSSVAATTPSSSSVAAATPSSSSVAATTPSSSSVAATTPSSSSVAATTPSSNSTGGSTTDYCDGISTIKEITSCGSVEAGTSNQVCFKISASVSGWGLSNGDGRSCTNNGSAVSGGGSLTASGDGSIYITCSAGSHSYFAFYCW